MPIHTDRTIAANWPDIVVNNKKDKTCPLSDMTIPLDTNTSVKTTKKLNKNLIQGLGNRGWANEGAQNNNSPSGYGSPLYHQEGHGKLYEQNPWQHQHTWTPEITLLFTAYLLRRVLSIKIKIKPLYLLLKSMVWTRMLREKIPRNYTRICWLLIIITISIISVIFVI